MKRFHALEWEDLSWFPKSWRDFGTDYLEFFARRFDIYKSIVPLVKQGLTTAKDHTWIDCGSGGGGGLINIAKTIHQDFPDLKIILTDYYPNIEAFQRTVNEGGELITYNKESVDAMSIHPQYASKLRTMFATFHHFRSQQAKRVLQNAVDSNSPIAIFEPIGRNLFSFLSMLFVIPNVLIFTLFIRPVRLSVLPFVYLIPLIPLYILWDGIASILRIYSEDELRGLVKSLDNAEKFDWQIGTTDAKPMGITYLLATPKRQQVL